MPKFIKSLYDWESDTFTQTLKSELENLETSIIPLDKGTSQGGYVDDSNITATVLRVSDDMTTIHAHVGIFFTEIVVGCGCGDDPMPTNAYCEMQIDIDKATGESAFIIINK